MINSITNKQETTITLGSKITIGQFGQVKETATPGVKNSYAEVVLRRAH